MTYASLVRKYPREILYGFLHFFFSGLGQTFLLGFFVASFTESLSITNQEFNGYYSGATLVSALMLSYAGKYLDKVKVRYFSLAIAVLMIVFVFITASMQYAWMLGIALFGLRFTGQGLMPLTGATATARYFEEGRGKALSLVGFGISFSEFLLPLLVTFLILQVGWRSTWLFLAGGVVFIFIPLVLRLVPLSSKFQLIQEEASEDQPSTAMGATRAEVLRDPKFYLLAMVNLWVSFFITGVFINQDLLAGYYDWPIELVATGVSIFGLTRFVANIFFGGLIDKYSAVRCFSYVLFPLVAACLLMIFNQSIPAMILFFLLCGVSGSLSGLTVTAMWAEVYGTLHLGAIRSTVSTFGVFAAALAPLIFGWAFRNESSLNISWMVLAGLMLLSTIISFQVVRKMRKKAS